MRCLYCGKELALLKRLTNSADFCSEAHRQSYQDQFNELALGRLEQARQAQARETPPNDDEDEPVEIGAGTSWAAGVRTVGRGKDGPGGQHRASSLRGRGNGLPRRRSDPPPEPDLGRYLPQWFLPVAPEAAEPRGTQPPEASGSPVEYPCRDPYRVVTAAKCSRVAPRAKQVRWVPLLKPIRSKLTPRGRMPEAREFSRVPTQPSPRLLQGETYVPAATQNKCEVKIAPRRPAKGVVWWAKGPEFMPPDVTLGRWSRLEGRPLGSEVWIVVAGGAKASASLATLERAVNLERNSERGGTQPAGMPDPVLTPLPVAMEGASPGAVRQATLVPLGPGLAVQPRVPEFGGLPLRPVMMVGQTAPADGAGVPALQPIVGRQAVPQHGTSQNTKEEARRRDVSQSLARTVRGAPVKVRRDVRVIPAVHAASAPSAVTKAQGRPAAQRPEVSKDTQRIDAGKDTSRADSNKQEAAKREAVKPESNKQEIRAARTEARISVESAQSGPASRSGHSFIPDASKSSRAIARVAEAAFSTEDDYPSLKLHTTEGPLERLSGGVKIAIAVVLLVCFGGLGYVALNRGAGKGKAADSSASTGYEVGLPVANTGWIEDWAPEGSGKRISILKGSQPLSDYRMEFSAQIENKAIGWIFRGMNPRNYYVAKIEALKPGLEPTVALVRYAVIDGKIENRQEKLLPMKTRAGMTYKVRFEAVGSHFAAWVQDQKIDEWRDTRIGSGGVGMYAEGNEAALVNGLVHVTGLVPK